MPAIKKKKIRIAKGASLGFVKLIKEFVNINNVLYYTAARWILKYKLKGKYMGRNKFLSLGDMALSNESITKNPKLNLGKFKSML